MSYKDRNAECDIDEGFRAPHDFVGGWRIVVCLLLVFLGVTLGMIALALVSNQFGNTDVIGIPLIGVAGWLLATGLSYLRFRFPFAAMIGMFAAPVAVVGLFVLFWCWLILTAVLNASR